jgi:hypothetical protein
MVQEFAAILDERMLAILDERMLKEFPYDLLLRPNWDENLNHIQRKLDRLEDYLNFNLSKLIFRLPTLGNYNNFSAAEEAKHLQHMLWRLGNDRLRKHFLLESMRHLATTEELLLCYIGKLSISTGLSPKGVPPWYHRPTLWNKTRAEAITSLIEGKVLTFGAIPPLSLWLLQAAAEEFAVILHYNASFIVEPLESDDNTGTMYKVNELILTHKLGY